MSRVPLMAWLTIAGGLLCLPGCVMFDVGVTNPVQGLTTVAVAPFFNLSAERSVDGRRFAEAYFAELQKTPGFQVLPVGVVEQAIHDHQLRMEGPDDALKLCAILGVDAVVLGGVTDYSPYYPPRIGLQVSWYSPRPWNFFPGVQVDENAWRVATKPPTKRWPWSKDSPATSAEECQPTAPISGTVTRGQSPDSPSSTSESWWPKWSNPFRGRTTTTETSPQTTEVRESSPEPTTDIAPTSGNSPQPVPTMAPVLAGQPVHNPRLPFMSYTRMFDGSDPKLTARLRDYVELSGDLRSGGWQAYLHRSEDFIRFTAHVMVVEMFQLHGGEARRRVVVKPRKYW